MSTTSKIPYSEEKEPEPEDPEVVAPSSEETGHI